MIVKHYFNRKIPTSLAFIIILLSAFFIGRIAWKNYIESNNEKIGSSEIKISKKQGGLPLDKLKNAEYGTCWNPDIGKVKFTNGSYLKPPPNPQWTTGGWSISIVEDKIVFGDLNNDGEEDDILVLNSSGGGSGSFYEIIAVINEDGKPVYVDCEKLGDRVKINSIDIKSGKIVIDMTFHAENDPMCCPTLRETVNYQLSGDELIEI